MHWNHNRICQKNDRFYAVVFRFRGFSFVTNRHAEGLTFGVPAFMTVWEPYSVFCRADCERLCVHLAADDDRLQLKIVVYNEEIRIVSDRNASPTEPEKLSRRLRCHFDGVI